MLLEFFKGNQPKPLHDLADHVLCKGQWYWINAPAVRVEKSEATGARLELLFRYFTLQIERVTHGPGEVIPLHRHPKVDSYEFPLWGSGELQLNRRKFFLEEESAQWDEPIFISHKTWHGGKAGHRGGAFLSVQRWIGMSPIGSVIKSWEPKVDAHH